MKKILFPVIVVAAAAVVLVFALSNGSKRVTPEGVTSLSIENGVVRCSVEIENGALRSERLELVPGSDVWSAAAPAPALEMDGDFAIEVMFTDWSAPGRVDNADNPVLLTRKDFTVVSSEIRDDDGGRELALDCVGVNHPIELRIGYRLEPGAFFAKRILGVRDAKFGRHFLRWFWQRRGSVEGVASAPKEGGFGQPVAVTLDRGSAFFGVEYPAAENRIEPAAEGRYTLRCGQEHGALIGAGWIASDWAVAGLCPDANVKRWFFAYLDRVRVAPLRPYALYNTWYDLRSPEYPDWSKDRVMSETSCLAMAKVLREKMIERHGITLDAFVLDDGWDVYDSDWRIREKEWPNGFKPLADELAKMGTSLGVWIGPTGGYSFHSRRLAWMKDHGYETVGDMLCVAGAKYGALLRERVADFVERGGVRYFKWDGIQFSCSEPGHGHPIDVYSRRATMESVAAMCRAAREKHPDMFLNISSGTWLSPWWVRFANTIWMQGMDYGFADVPSISRRDGSITYRDFVLYDDFRVQDRWFPIANLMTHGIIKGKDFSVGVETEPLDKFTDDVLLYFARGVAMYELYVSPDILSDGEWNSISRSMAWARDRFPVLMSTEMVGGNPMKGESYAWVHFLGKRGILAARNPVMPPATISIELSAAQGLDPGAANLVLERVYPTRWISPELHRAGESVTLPLDGFETAVYEVYPVEEATWPLVAGAVFDVVSESGASCSLRFHGAPDGVRILNPDVAASVSLDGPRAETAELLGAVSHPVEPARECSASRDPRDASAAIARFALDPSVTGGALAVLLVPDEKSAAAEKPSLRVTLDGAEAAVSTEPQEGRSQWFTVPLAPGSREARVKVVPARGAPWRGAMELWLVVNQRQATRELSIELARPPAARVMPPLPWPAGEIRRNVPLGKVRI